MALRVCPSEDTEDKDTEDDDTEDTGGMATGAVKTASGASGFNFTTPLCRNSPGGSSKVTLTLTRHPDPRVAGRRQAAATLLA